MTPARRSATPADEVDAPRRSSGSSKSALIVKSRRLRVVLAREPKCTALGRRPSTYASSERNVATSKRAPSLDAPGSTPNCAPTGTVRRKSARHRLGRRAGRDVVVARLAAEQAVADAAAREVRLVAGGAQPPDDVSREPPPVRHAAYVKSTFTAPDVALLAAGEERVAASCSSGKRCVRIGVTSMRRSRTRSR